MYGHIYSKSVELIAGEGKAAYYTMYSENEDDLCTTLLLNTKERVSEHWERAGEKNNIPKCK